ncbi:ABC transporter permease [Bacillus toyonensis]|uniref:ABC transporter permease n=1 Tax=Bacillus toyonensis TaxID=155322 RepID=UPI0021D19A45|nr:ABC transporter permease [Bacillus toyonensis]MCU4967892.1 ABC transporter permease [Bacillus toyonensis]
MADSTKASGFRALASFIQPVFASFPLKLMFMNVQFDLKKEYELPSTFVPKSGGVYTVSANAAFNPENLTKNSLVILNIHVNDILVATNNELFVSGMGTLIIEVNTIIQLKAKDRVEVFILALDNGRVFPASSSSSFMTSFQAIRSPSPL